MRRRILRVPVAVRDQADKRLGGRSRAEGMKLTTSGRGYAGSAIVAARCGIEIGAGLSATAAGQQLAQAPQTLAPWTLAPCSPRCPLCVTGSAAV